MAVLVMAVLAGGCRFSGVPAPPPLEASGSDLEALPYRVALAPVRVDFAPAELYRDDRTRRATVPDLEELRQEVGEALRAARLFQRVQPRGQTGTTRERLRDLLWAEQDDLVLEIELLDYHQAYLGHVNYLLWVLVYTTYIWPAWMIPIDEYGAGLRARVRLRSVQEGAQPLWEAEFEVRPQETKQEFRPTDRATVGFLDIGALWNVETSLEEANWQAIERGVGPHARRRLADSMVRDLTDRVAAPLRAAGGEHESMAARARKRFALVVGVAEHQDPAVGTTPSCGDDARRVAEFFASPRGGALVEGRDLLLLVDEQATRATILDGVAALASRASAGDEVVVYLAGCGAATSEPLLDDPAAAAALGGLPGVTTTSSRGRPTFLAYDAQKSDLAATGLALRDLGRALGAVPAERLVVVLDAAFSGQGGRTLSPPEGAPSLVSADLARALLVRPGRCALFASGVSEGAHTLVEGHVGLFTQALLDGLEGAADADGDDRVALVELIQHVRAEVASRAGLEGVTQTPRAFLAGDVPMTWPR